MTSNWPEVELQDLAHEITVGYVGSMTSQYIDDGIPFFRSKNIVPFGLDWSDVKYISEEFHQKIKKSRLAHGDVAIVRTGIPGTACVIPETVVNANCSDLVIVRPNKERVLPEFLCYWMNSIAKNQINAQVVGAVQQHFNVGSAKKLIVALPSIEEQYCIVKILKSIDDKIALNSRINQTLEEMAQTLFKSWFVDFGPVKAKMRGEQPVGMDHKTAELFPDKMVESELGLIPDGWSVEPLSKLITLTGGGTPKRSESSYWNGEIPWFSVKDVPSGSDVFVIDTGEKITQLGLDKSSTKLLRRGTTIISARGTVGKLALVGTDMCMNQSCYGVTGIETGDYFNYFNLKQAVATLQQNTHGAVFDTITTKTFDTYSLAFSGEKLANKFDALVTPLLEKIENNVRESIELACLRDTLLPKLLSGEISIENTYSLVEAV